MEGAQRGPVLVVTFFITRVCIFPQKNRKRLLHTNPDPLQYPTAKYNPIQSTLRGFHSVRRVSHGAHGDPAVGMYKKCTKEEALKSTYEHISGKVGERWKPTQSQLKAVRTPVAILGSLGVCIYVPTSRHWLISYSPIHLA